MFILYVHFIRLHRMFILYLHFAWSFRMFISFVHFICSFHKFISYVHYVCSFHKFITYVHFVCSFHLTYLLLFSFSVGLHTRHTAINTVVLGFMSFFTIYGFTQSTLQRVSTMPDLLRVRRWEKIIYRWYD